MQKKFLIAVIVVVGTVGFLIFQAVTATAKAVVTVSELEAAGSARNNIRLGARVADVPVEFGATASDGVSFFVRDVTGDEKKILRVHYGSALPDNLKAGRDVIVEGNFDGSRFEAKTVLTQCPSKYVPPAPGKQPVDQGMGTPEGNSGDSSSAQPQVHKE